MDELDISELVNRYEQMLQSGKSIYFDAEEFDALAEYFDIQEDLPNAKIIIDTGLSIHPDNYMLKVKKAKFMIYENQNEECLAYLQNNFSGAYDFELYLIKLECYIKLGLYDKIDSVIEDILNDEEVEPEVIYAEIGFIFVESDHFREGIKFLEKSISFNPSNTDVLADLAYAYEMEGDYENALKITNKILDIDPYSYEAWMNAGKLYSIIGQFEDAIDAFDFALVINKDDETLIRLKAHCLSLCDRQEEALQLYKECLVLKPDEGSLYYSMAECYMALQQYEDMLECIDKYVEIEGESADTIGKKAVIYFQKEDYEESRRLVQEGLLLDKESGTLNMIAGVVDFQLEQYESAEKYLQKAFEKLKENDVIADKLSIMKIWNNEFKEATRILEEFMEYNVAPETVLKIRLALLYIETGKKVRFNEYIQTFNNEELKTLASLFYSDEVLDMKTATRETLINRLNDARECRQLFKNIKY